MYVILKYFVQIQLLILASVIIYFCIGSADIASSTSIIVVRKKFTVILCMYVHTYIRGHHITVTETSQIINFSARLF